MVRSQTPLLVSRVRALGSEATAFFLRSSRMSRRTVRNVAAVNNEGTLGDEGENTSHRVRARATSHIITTGKYKQSRREGLQERRCCQHERTVVLAVETTARTPLGMVAGVHAEDDRIRRTRHEIWRPSSVAKVPWINGS
jgi:hypothetical protein